MVETKTKTPDFANFADFANVEETLNTLAEKNQKTMSASMDFTRKSMDASYKIVKDVQEEHIRFADAMFGQLTSFQKSYFKSIQDYTQEFYKYTDRAMKENQTMLEDVVEKTMDMTKPAMNRKK